MKGYELARRVCDHLESTLSHLDITVRDNYWDNALWHARITGCIAEAGIINGFRIELGRRFMKRKFSKEIDYSDFLKKYCALYDKYVGKWVRFGEGSSTEIDVTFLDKQNNSAIALCEYENRRYEVKDNIVKFKALNAFDPERFKPELCLISFWAGSSRKNVEMILEEVIKLIADMSKQEEASFREVETYHFEPLKCHWLLSGLFKDGSLFMIKGISTILDPNANKIDENEFDVGSTVH
jgi:hypothetical protein